MTVKERTFNVQDIHCLVLLIAQHKSNHQSKCFYWCFTLSRRAGSFYWSIVTPISFVFSPWLIWSPALSSWTTCVCASQFGTGLIFFTMQTDNSFQCSSGKSGQGIGLLLKIAHTLADLFWNTPLFYLQDDALLLSSLVTQSSLALNSITEAKRSKNVLVPKQRSLSGSVLRPEQAVCIFQNLCHNALFCAACTLVTCFVIMIHGRSLFGNTFVSSEMFSADVIQREGNSRLWGEIFPAKISLAHHFGKNVSSECYSLLLAGSVKKQKSERNEQDY